MAARSGTALLQTEGTRRRLRQEDAETDGEGAGGGDAETLKGEGARIHQEIGRMLPEGEGGGGWGEVPSISTVDPLQRALFHSTMQ